MRDSINRTPSEVSDDVLKWIEELAKVGENRGWCLGVKCLSGVIF